MQSMQVIMRNAMQQAIIHTEIDSELLMPNIVKKATAVINVEVIKSGFITKKDLSFSIKLYCTSIISSYVIVC